jgi:hypothetical protein
VGVRRQQLQVRDRMVDREETAREGVGDHG